MLKFPHAPIKPLRGLLAALALAVCVCLSGGAQASGGYHLATPAVSAAPSWDRGGPAITARFVWSSASGVAAAAERWVGSGKFTPFAGPWCADAASAWLSEAGKPPLANRMAASALSYGPRGNGAPGDLAVFVGRRGYAYHVGVVVASLGAKVEIISGNWSHRVGRAILPRRGLIFVRT